MKRIPVQIQLFLILFSVLVIPMSIITFYTSSSMMEYSQEEIAESTMSRSKSNGELANLVFNDPVLDILKLVKENKFKDLKNIQSYKQLTSNFDSINNAIKIMDELHELQVKDSVVYSVMYYVDNADYVLSTNKGIVPLRDYEDMKWIESATDQRVGAGGVWYPRYLNSSTVREQELDSNETTSFPVVSFVYQLNRLTTSAKGTIVINMYEDKLHDYLSIGQKDNSTTDFIIDKKGRIISHNNKELLFSSVKESDYIQKILKSNLKEGFDFVQLNNESFLYTYNKDFINDWTYVTTYSMDSLLEQSNNLRTSYLILTVVMFLLGTIFTLFASRKFVQPVKRLVHDMKTQFNYNIDKNTNELSFLEQSFNHIREDEEALYELLNKKNSDTKSLLIHKLLSGDNISIYDDDELKTVFPYFHYLVAIVSIDDAYRYMKEDKVDTRNYHRYKLIEKIEQLFSKEYEIVASRYDSDKIAVIINIEHYDQSKVRRNLNNIFVQLKEQSVTILDKTLTIAISGVHTDYYSISDCVFEAIEVLQMRLIRGKNQIFYYETGNKESKKLVYSYNTEKKILNYLELGDIQSIEQELYEMVVSIKEVEEISNDNVMLNFNQLIGSTMKYLVENNLNTSKIFKNNMNLYSKISTFDTIDEIKDYLIDVYHSILEYNVPKDDYEPNHIDRVMKYLSEHYNEDLVLEDVASQIGISYSYLRKLVKEETGKSVIDNINLMRIDEVKRLLLQTDSTMTEIAEKVGYRNVQSVNRFFKKYEGISPTEFKALNR